MANVHPGGAMPAAEVVEASRAFMVAARRMNTLYELSAEYQRLLDLLEDPEADETALEAELDAVADRLVLKAEAIGGLITHLNHIGEARRVEARRLTDRARADEAHAERLRDYLFRHMQAINVSRLETTRFTIAIRINPPAVEVLDEALVPSEFVREVVTTSIDKRAILEHVKADGEIPPGIDIVRRQRLEVR